MDYDYPGATQTTGSDGAIGAVIAIMVLLIVLFYVVPLLIATWKLYQKAGKPGWSAIVPVYSSVVMAEIAKKPLWMGVVAGVAGFSGYLFGRPIDGLLSLVGAGFGLFILIHFIKQYDRGFGFWAAYILLPIVAVFLADKANYTGGALATNNPVAPAPAPGIAPAPAPGIAPAQQPYAVPTPTPNPGQNQTPPQSPVQ